MWRYLLFHPLILTFGLLSSKGKPYDPMVAFVCNKGAMHMDPTVGWSADSHVDCLGTKQQILDYCKLMYPQLDVQNIVETTESMIIKGWCPLGTPKCSEPDTFRVQPYRCLTGPYQSDTLVVPNKCHFSYLHDNSTCAGPEVWKKKAMTHCSTKYDMLLEDYGMLAPCGVDKFIGADFVCCPSGVSNSDLSTPAVPLENPKIRVKVTYSNNITDQGQANEDVVDEYKKLKMNAGVYENEHEIYKLAKEKLEEDEDTTASIQTNQQELVRLDSLHQQHVQTNLNAKKRLNMQKLTGELRSDVYNAERITHFLQLYIKAEEKDARHCLQHYMNIRGHDLSAAQSILDATIEHITLISVRINQSIDLLDTIKDERVRVKVTTSVRSWLVSAFPPLHGTITQLISYKTESVITESTKSPSIQSTHLNTNMYKHFANKLSKTAFIIEENNQVTKKQPVSVAEKTAQATGTNKQHLNDISVDEKDFSLLVLITVMAVLLILLVPAACCCYARRRKIRHFQGHRRLKNMYLAVSEQTAKLSPEDRHIVAMQNGYENPTYKLLEEKIGDY
ncbi:Appl [Bugula neritina]|uniref:Appl n=1 Tax=Bugula neritina TaxID=10212 RepID=A0A7J7JTD6_BUGNE|nr:Appl [Bugula neritina]